VDSLQRQLAQLPADEYWGIFAVAVVFSVLGVFYGFRFLWRYKVIENTPTSRIRSAHQGYNEFEGTAQLLPGEPIIAPLTRLSCVWYSYAIEERVQTGKNSSWVTRESAVSDNLFLLQGRTGQAIVDPDDAEVYHSVLDSWYGSSFQPTGGPRSMGSSSWFGGGRYRYTEKRIQMDVPLLVLGQFSTERHVASYAREDLSSLLKMWKENPQKLLADFDKNKDGQLDEGEWQGVVVLAKKLLMDQLAETRSAQTQHLIHNTKDSRQPFIIAAKEQNAMVASYRWRAWSWFVAFVVCGGLAVWMFNIRF
jgi:hypothetical protein